MVAKNEELTEEIRMMLNTKHFGEIEIDENKIITFEEGIMGFEELKRYIVLYNGDEMSPFRWLQCIEKPELAFAVVNPFMVMRSYDMEISDAAQQQLGIKSIEEVMVLSIVVVPEEIEKMTMNLKAPVVINTSNNRGMQIALDTDVYGVRHNIMEEIRKQDTNVCVAAAEDK